MSSKTTEQVKSATQPEPWNLRLYIAGRTARNVAAEQALRGLCATHLAGRHEIQVVDLLVNPRAAEDDQVVAIPTLVRRKPVPSRKIIGDLSDVGRVLVALDLDAAPQLSGAA